MSEAFFIVKNYAKALFLSAQKENAVEKIQSELEVFAKHLTENFAVELKKPTISKVCLLNAFAEISKKAGFSDLTTGFLSVLAVNKRFFLFAEIHEEFLRLVREKNNILVAELITAGKIDDAVKSAIKANLESKYSGKKIELNEIEKKQILGGFQVKIGSKVLDASLKNQIELLADECQKVVN